MTEPEFTVSGNAFEYQVGMWERPINGQPAKLMFGDRIKTTATVDAFDLGDSGSVRIVFRLGKPKKVAERCFGWHDSKLEFKVVLGSKSDTFVGLGKMYHDMAAGTTAKFRLDLDLSDNTDPIHNKLHLILSDEVNTPKMGLHFYEASVYKK